MRIIFFGTPEFAVPSLYALLDSGHEVLAVVTQPDKQSGRGRHMTACPVKQEAQRTGRMILQPQKVKEAAFAGELRQLTPDVIVVVAYGQILPPEIIHLPRYGCINVHASLLPKYRGAAPINRAIINGDDKTGITTMLMDEGMDTGPILLQTEIAIEEGDTAGSLSDKLSRLGAEILIKTLTGLEQGDIKPRPQSGDASYAPALKKTDGLILWSKPARELCNFIRGMNPWPGAYSFLKGKRVKILKAAALDGAGASGVVIKAAQNELAVGAGEGLVSILEVQPEGKPAMSISAFLQGRKISEGMRCYEYAVD
ncbi:MAG: methionyl-tRNA formyltransferase [Nitrospirae bacterium]|nr:methionyl-tRNA formyltransferase [Nitrospirota bacterium]MBI4838183.1 methionyl-tRNA formyltransferase [Nitrospirota bacterium]